MALEKGNKAPDFTLKQKTADGLVDVTLSAQFGSKKTVLLFFPLAFTGVCEAELCSISGALGEYLALDATVYGISVDSPFAQEGFAKAAGIKIPLLSDFNRTVSTAYDVLYDEFLPGILGFKGVSKRSAFVIDKAGVITWSWSSDNPKDLPSFDAIKAALK
jgi:peroxiredoxin